MAFPRRTALALDHAGNLLLSDRTLEVNLQPGAEFSLSLATLSHLESYAGQDPSGQLL
jgi:hypothetical protein